MRRVAVAAALTAGVFAVVKTTTAGASAYAWGLGTVQWLLTGAWLRGEAPMPVAIVRDPTDLVALPAVLVAVLVARAVTGSQATARRRSSRLAGPALALLAGVASIATSQAAPTAMATTTEEITLDALHPVAATRVAWSIDLAGASSGQAWFKASASTDGDGLPRGVELILVPEGPLAAEGTGSSSRQIMIGGCQVTCGGQATVVVRAQPEAFDSDVPLVVSLETYAMAALESDAEAAAATVTVEQRRDMGIVHAPSAIETGTGGELRAHSDRPGVVRLDLVVDPDAIDRDRGWPLVGRIEVAVNAEGVNRPWFTGTLDGLEEGVVVEHGVPVVVDWLGGCPADGECRMPLELVVTPAFDEEGRQIELRASWSAQVRLEAFDGRVLPADGLAIEVR